MLKVIEIGERVRIHDKIVAKIKSINIKCNNYIQYECSWVDGQEYTSKWFDAN